MVQYDFSQEKTQVVLLDKIDVIASLRKQAEKEGKREHCVLALGKRIGDGTYEISDSCAVEEMGGSTGRNLSTIPRKVSLALIQLCVKQELVPIILHTHAPGICPNMPVVFSRKDQTFMEQFSGVAIAQGLKAPCLFLVTNGRSILLCDTSNANQGLNFPKSNGKHCERNAAKDMQEQALRRAHFGSGLNICQVTKPIEERFDGLPHRTYKCRHGIPSE